MSLAYKLYRLKWHLAKFIVPKNPLNVDLELSSVCNLKCSFCPQSEAKVDFPREFMKFEIFKDIIDEIQDKVPAIKFNLRGEATLHPEFERFITYTSEKFLDVRINTNGNYKGEGVSWLLVNVCDEVSFSVDAFYKDTYAKIRKGGDFDLLNYNIQTCISIIKHWHLKTVLKLSLVVTKENEGEVEVFKRYWKAQYPNIKFLIRREQDRLHLTDILNPQNRKNCYMPNRRLVVASDGTVMPCCVAGWNNPMLKVGKIQGHWLLSIWVNEAMYRLRKNLRKIHKREFLGLQHPACIKCDSAESYVQEDKNGKRNYYYSS